MLMTKHLGKLILTSILLVGMSSPVLAESPTERILRSQDAQIQELNLQLQAQRNQERIERMQQQLERGIQNHPEVVVIQQERRGPSIPSVILGAVLSNGYVSCGNGRSCGYGYGNSGQRWGGRWKLSLNKDPLLTDIERDLSDIKPINNDTFNLGNDFLNDTVNGINRNIKIESTIYGRTYGSRIFFW